MSKQEEKDEKEEEGLFYRTDLLKSPLNKGKRETVFSVLCAYRVAATLIAQEQWKLFYTTGRFQKNFRSPQEDYLSAVAGMARRAQMARYQVVGGLRGFMESRNNDFGRIVERSTLPDSIKHELHVLKKSGKIHSPDPVVMKETEEEISPEVRRLARHIMNHVLSRHRRPDFSNCNMVLDGRVIDVEDAETSTEFPLWLRMSTMIPGKKVSFPLEGYEYFKKRKGQRCNSIQINEKDGELYFGVVTDTTLVFENSREEYEKAWKKRLQAGVAKESIHLDWGMRTLLATDRGDLLGRGFLKELEKLDRKITDLAAYRQKHGLPVRSKKYDKLVRKLRGYLATEIGRVVNRLVAVHMPRKIVVERLYFNSPGLSRRMNRLVGVSGRRVIKKKLESISEEFRIEIIEMNPAYSSQECSCCGYVDKRNRNKEVFQCLWCGSRKHADVNAACTLKSRRSWLAGGGLRMTKQKVLEVLVSRHLERFSRCTNRCGGTSGDPRLSNPYFQEWSDGVTSSNSEACGEVPSCADGLQFPKLL